MLNQIAPPRALGLHVGEQPANDVELVISRPDLDGLLPARLRVSDFDDLRVVLEDVGETLPREYTLPKVVCLEAVRVRRIASPVVPPQVERQEPRTLAREMRAEADFLLVHRKMDHAAAELEQLLARVAVTLVLRHCIRDRLFREAVLQFEGRERQAVDEQRDIESALGLVAAIAKLARDAETVGPILLGGLDVASGRRAVEEIEMVRAVLDPVPQHVDGAALGDLALQAGEELAPRRAVLREVE